MHTVGRRPAECTCPLDMALQAKPTCSVYREHDLEGITLHSSLLPVLEKQEANAFTERLVSSKALNKTGAPGCVAGMSWQHPKGMNTPPPHRSWRNLCKTRVTTPSALGLRSREMPPKNTAITPICQGPRGPRPERQGRVRGARRLPWIELLRHHLCRQQRCPEQPRAAGHRGRAGFQNRHVCGTNCTTN